MAREELQKTYSKLSTEELLEIIDRKFDYTDTAVSVALEEISKRKVDEDEIKNYKEDQLQKIEKSVKGIILDDLTLFQKNFFFFIWIPLFTFPFKQNFKDDGYVLKLKQANYYSLIGFIFFMLTAFFSVSYDFENLTSLGLWILSFPIANSFDEFFNRQRLIKRLRRFINQEDQKTES
ncbi:hypothetical protein [Terrimonas pollutisoli]|uniref:hypothetical protein n=1 Tax=Terrimonas pollutisoli TaxID=3034147 RepID=UPI0023EBB3A4|nr:hypothetical protein [Terrimonas sp. H1YJ31]